MVLVDTSIWVDHFQKNDEDLVGLLNDFKAVLHPFIIGELACGNLKNRNRIISLLYALPLAKEITNSEYMSFIEQNKLFGLGIGFVDVHLLASALISNVTLYTRDKSLYSIASKFKIQYN
jgi:predicted nucleic acid-binding protein